MKFALALLGSATLALLCPSPATAARGGHAGANALPRRRHHARLASSSLSLDTSPLPPPSAELVPRGDYPLPTGWAYKGCALDAASRLLSGASVFEEDMTAGRCVELCADRGFEYAGVECASPSPPLSLSLS